MELQTEIIEKIKEIAGASHVREQEPMSRHTTMEVGGPALCYVEPQEEQQIVQLLTLLRREQIPYMILGNGSNVIFRDEGYPGVVVCLAEGYAGYEIFWQVDSAMAGVKADTSFAEISLQEEEVLASVKAGTSNYEIFPQAEADLIKAKAGTSNDAIFRQAETALVRVKAGTSNKDFAQAMTEEGLAGFEFASGIPGSIGGATAMNAGAYEGEMKQIIESVKLLAPDGSIIIRTNAQMDFGYRHSLVSEGDYVVLETVFRLHKDDPAAIKARVDDLTKRRQEKQPLELLSCGSTFKRPEGHFAGKLISDAGLKGYSYGGAQVSEKHAGFIVNYNHASAADVLGLIELVKEKVYESQGVRLECEVKIV